MATITALTATTFDDGSRLLKVDGNLDLAGVGAIETRFYAFCGGENPRVVVDLSGVQFVASLGIRLLLQAAKTVKSRQGTIQFIHPTETARSALEIAGLDSLIG
jgi:anti-anti-sigma factor